MVTLKTITNEGKPLFNKTDNEKKEGLSIPDSVNA